MERVGNGRNIPAAPSASRIDGYQHARDEWLRGHGRNTQTVRERPDHRRDGVRIRFRRTEGAPERIRRLHGQADQRPAVADADRRHAAQTRGSAVAGKTV